MHQRGNHGSSARAPTQTIATVLDAVRCGSIWDHLHGVWEFIKDLGFDESGVPFPGTRWLDPTVVVVDGDERGLLRAFDFLTGAEMWRSYSFEAERVSPDHGVSGGYSSLAIGRDGTVFVATPAGQLHAFGR